MSNPDDLETVRDHVKLKKQKFPTPNELLATAENRWTEYVDDPVAFCYEQLNEKELEKFQVRALNELAAGHRSRVAVKSYHGAGKTKLAALAAKWFFMTRPFSNVIITAPTEQQVKDRMFGELSKIVRQSNFREQLEDHMHTLRLEMPGLGKEWFVQGRVSNKPVNIEGYHAPHILYIIDEAKGVQYAIFDAIEGALTNEDGDVRVLMISTPSLNRSGYFFDTFKSKRMAGMYKLINVGLGDSKRVSKAWREEKKKQWGENSPVYQTRVLGEFPEEAEGTMFPPKLVEPAIEREDIAAEGVVAIGADIARFGEDLIVFIVRHGGKVTRIIEYGKQDTMTTASMLRMLALDCKANLINIDDTGVGGGVVDRMRVLKEQFSDKWEINAVDMGSAAKNPVRFANARAELSWGLRERFEEETISIPDHPTMQADLLAYKYSFNFREQVRMEPKEDMKERIGRSPDYGDALILAFFEAPKVGAPKISYWDPELDRVVTV